MTHRGRRKSAGRPSGAISLNTVPPPPPAAAPPPQAGEERDLRRGNLSEFFAASPLRGSKLKVQRFKGGLRKVELS